MESSQETSEQGVISVATIVTWSRIQIELKFAHIHWHILLFDGRIEVSDLNVFSEKYSKDSLFGLHMPPKENGDSRGEAPEQICV